MKSIFFAIVGAIVIFGSACSRHEVHGTLPAPAERPGKTEHVPPGPEKKFPDYRPKTSPDVVTDYRPEIAGQLSSLPGFQLKNLAKLLSEFHRWNDRAKKEPGHFQEGNMILGAPSKEYRPSDAELLAAYLGDGLKKLVKASPAGALVKLMSEQGITGVDATFRHFDFNHVDVMGSGRFFYSSEPIETKLTFPTVQ